MRLLLTITSEEGRELGHRARCEFGVEGGAIGRNAACAWVLPDPTNVLSARHATIAFNGRGFEIADTSTNGVYLNTVKAPIGRGSRAFLSHGDTLYLGPFEVSVAILEDAAEERRRLGVGEAAIAVRSEATPRGEMAPMRAGSAIESPALSAALALPTTAAAPMPPWLAPAAEQARAASAGSSLGLVSAAPAAPAIPQHPPTAPRPARPAIPADVFADILGPAAMSNGASPPATSGSAAPLASSRADPLGFVAPQAPRACAPLIPDAFDFADLLKSPSPASVPPPSAQSWPIAAPAISATPAIDLPPVAPVAAPPPPEPPPPEPPPPEPPLPTRSAPYPSASAPARPPALSASLSADLIALRPPGAAAEAAGARELDPIVVLRQRAAGHIRPAAADGIGGGAPVAPAARLKDGAAPLPRLADDRNGAPSPATAPQGRLAEAFWSGLGVDLKGTPPERQAELLAECGRALRAAVVGLVPTLGARRSMKDELRIDQTRLQPKENNPLKFLPSGDAVLKALVDRELDGFLPLSQALQEGLDDIKAHEVATVVALDAVVKSMLARFDPVALEAQGGAPSKMFGRGPDKTRLWDEFVRVHAALSGNLEETTRKLVGEEFAQAYAQQIETFRRGGA
jgi:type VI secretion system FHA domain protein